MSSDYKVIIFHPQHFGNEANTFTNIVPASDFARQAKEFGFDCPNINTREIAVLTFQSLDVDYRTNVFRVNDADIIGGLPLSSGRDAWNGNIMLVPPHHRLKATGNVLRVESRDSGGGTSGDIDDFVLDNVVIMYKTQPSPPTNQV
jgi:hypothetical protein